MAIALPSAVLVTPALAQLINPFPNSEVALQQSDLREMQETAAGLLNGTEKSGAAAAWENGETGRRGTVTILDTNKRQDLTCHNIRYTFPVPNRAQTRSYTLNWCKTPEGWRIAS